MAELNQTLFNDGKILYKLDPSLDWSEAHKETKNKVASGHAIQEYIKLLKADTDKRVGYFYVENDLEGKPYLHGFKDEDSWRLWQSDKDKYSHFCLTKIKVPLAVSRTDSYMNEFINLNERTTIISTDNTMVLKGKFVSWIFRAGSDKKEANPDTGIVHVQMKNGDVWNNLDLNLKVETNVPFEIDLTDYIKTTDPVAVRIYIEGELSKTNSNTILFSLIKTNLNIVDRTEWWEPQINNYIETKYEITGSVDKILHIKVSGKGGNGYREFEKELGTRAYVDPLCIYQAMDIGVHSTQIITHGIHTVEAWVTVKDTDISTQHVVSKILLVQDEDDKEPKLIINNVNNRPFNWIKNKFFDYSLYNPTNDIVNLRFDITDPITGEVYLSGIDDQAPANTKLTFMETLMIEGNNQANINTNIHVFINDVRADLITNVSIKNEGEYSPVAEADFILSPRSRSNKTNPDQIYNTAVPKGQPGYKVNSTWTNFNFNNNDGWIDDEQGNKCLRVLKNQHLKINYNPFYGWKGAHGNRTNESCTIEMYVAVRNVTDIEASVIRLYKGNNNFELPETEEEIQEDRTGVFEGFKLRSLDGIFLKKGQNFASRLDQDVAFQENEMTHIVININHKFIDKPGVKSNIVRMFINGRINREFEYTEIDNISDNEELARIISIGSRAADIDIYGLRVYKKSLSTLDIQKDYIAVLPSIELKQNEINASDILDEFGRISYNKVKDKYNILLWTYYPGSNAGGKLENMTRPAGMEFGDKGKKDLTQGDLIVRILKDGPNGTKVLDKKHSGIFTNISVGGQGTSSMTYWKWNQRWNIDNEKSPLAIFRNDEGMYWGGFDDVKDEDHLLEPDLTAITPGAPGSHVDELKNYVEKVETEHLVQGEYKGGNMCYPMFDDEPVIIKKFDGKINFASPQQSHKLGSTNLYNDLWKEIIQNNKEKVVEKTPTGENITYDKVTKAELTKIQEKYPEDGKKFTGSPNGYADCRMTVHQLPFFLFILPGKPGTTIPKIDAAIGEEGKNGSNEDCMGKAFANAEGQVSDEPVFWGLYTVGAGKGDKPTFGQDKKHWPDYIMMEGRDNARPLVNHRVPWNDVDVTIDKDGEKYIYNGEENWEISMGSDVAGSDAPHLPTKTLQFFREMCNFVYLLNPNLHGFNGSYEELTKQETQSRLKLDDFYWCSEDSSDIHHKKYDVYRFDNRPDINSWVDAGVNYTDVKNHIFEKVNLLTQLDITQDDVTVNSGTNTIEEINDYFKRKRLELFKGKDKNDGIRKYFDEDDLLYTMQYLKLIAASDNWAKNAYIYSPGQLLDAGESKVDESYQNKPVAKFRFFQDDLDTIFFTDNQGKKTKPYYVEEFDINYNDPNLNGYWPSNKNALYCSTDAAFEVEKRAMMHNILQAMINLSGGSGTGSVVNCFKKYYTHIQDYFPMSAYNETARLIYENSFEYFKKGIYIKDPQPLTQCLGDQRESELQWLVQRATYISSYATHGTWEAKDSAGSSGALSWRTSKVDGREHLYNFDLKPYMWLYPSIANGAATKYPDGSQISVRKQANEIVQFHDERGGANTNMFIRGINNYIDIGNFADVPLEGGSNFNVAGDRLESFRVIGTNEKPILFNPNTISFLNPANIKEVIIEGPVKKDYVVGTGTLNLTKANKLEILSIPSSNISVVSLPKNSNISKIYLPKTTQSIVLESQNKLVDFKLVNYAELNKLIIKDTFNSNPDEVYKIFNNCFNQSKLNTLELNNINWTNFTIEQLEYICSIENCRLTGTIELADNQKLSSELKIKLISKFKQIDSVDNPLYIKYKVTPISEVRIAGYSYLFFNDDEPHNCIYKAIAKPTDSNNIVKIEWSMSPNDYADINGETGVVIYRKPHGTDGSEKQYATIKCNVTYADQLNLGQYEHMIAEKQINFYEKVAEIGDYVYADGSYSSPDDNIDFKTVVGICMYVDKDGKNRKMVGLNNINTLLVDDKGTNLWGLSEKESGKHDTHPIFDYVAKKCHVRWGLDPSKVPNYTTDDRIDEPIYDVPNLENISTGQLGYTWQDYNNIKEEFIADENGFKEYDDPLTAMGDQDGFRNTQYIIDHRNKIIKGNFGRIPGERLDGTKPWPLNNSFGDLMYLIETSAAESTDNILKCAEYYPAASYCNAYEPIIPKNETLNDKFKRGNWYLPSFYELSLLCFFSGRYIKSAKGDKYNIFARPIDDKILDKFVYMSGDPEFSNKTNKIGIPTNEGKYMCSTELDETYCWMIYFRQPGKYYYAENNAPEMIYKAGESDKSEYYIRPIVKF